jgi:hypothetical protein
MNTAALVSKVLYDVFSVKDVSDGVFVTVPCLYPSNGMVSVMVRGGPNRFFVSDEGGALREILSAGADVQHPDKTLRRVLHLSGLLVGAGKISSPEVGLAELPAAIALVANASKDAADWLFDHCKIERRRDFKRIVRDFLAQTFVEQEMKTATVAGNSNKIHKFDNVISLPSGKSLIVDAVVHDMNSINSSVVANLDVQARSDPRLIQRIVYDDEDEWPAPDIALLSVGATVVPFSKSGAVFERLRAGAVQ